MASPQVAYVVAVALVLGALGAEPLATISSALAPRWEWAVGIGLATLVLLLVHDVNRLSAHAHYADALRRTFCGSSARRALHERDPERPVHLVNVTANLPSSRHATLRGCRPAVLSSCVSMYPIQGEPSAGSEDAVVGGGPFAAARAETAKSQREDTFADMDLGTAIAISGAAVSSRMGVVGPAGAAPWLTLLNLRMGYWIPNPVRTVRRRADARYLFRELAGVAHERLDRLDLSDGGHFENLAIYELIRRRCAYIVAIDGEADPALHLGGLHRLVHLARVDFGADIRIDTSSVRLDEDGVVARHFALGEIRYRDGAVGRLLYVKLSVSGDEPGYVHAYRRANPTFPHQSTADQLFDEAQFEAYRALGEHVGRALFRTEIVGSELAARAEARFGGGQGPRVEMARWFEAMEDRLLYRTAFPRPRRA